MAIIIKNMDMPEVCEQCRFYDTNYDYPTCLVTQHSKGYNFNGFKKRMLDCPLSENTFVRCTDCIYNDGTAYCELHFRDVDGNDFCSWGERRE